MIELKGKYTGCKIFNDEVEKEAISQVYSFLNHPAFENKKTRFMPDIHAGAGAVIGTTVELSNMVIPNVIGVDIGCGMLSVNIGKIDIDFSKLDDFISNNIPSGFSVHSKWQPIDRCSKEVIISTCYDIGIEHDRVMKSIGTLGGGNHFIEIGIDENKDNWITIHSGSRNFGLQIAKYHQKIAVKNMDKCDIDINLIPPKERQNFKENFKLLKEKIPKGMEYLKQEYAEKYFEHMKIAQDYAKINRDEIMSNIISFLKCEVQDAIESVHNYIDFEMGIIRKGAISAKDEEMVVIPWNMRDGLIIGKGKGNQDWNYSAPHGAGRIMSRSKAKEIVKLEDFEKSMEGIYSNSIVESTIDESPMAYKNHEEIEKYLSDTIEIIHRVKPLYNFKAK